MHVLCMHACVRSRMYVCLYECMCVHVYMHVYVCGHAFMYVLAGYPLRGIIRLSDLYEI